VRQRLCERCGIVAWSRFMKGLPPWSTMFERSPGVVRWLKQQGALSK
jgi:hypothetical protein